MAALTQQANAMQKALDRNDLDAARLLLDQGFDLDQSLREDDHYTALHWAAANGRLDACQLLIAAGADVDSRCRTGLGVIHFAANRRHPDICRLLLAAGADAHIRCYQWQTPLHWATIGGCEASCELLLAAGSNPNTEDRLGQPPMYYATKPEVFACLLAAGGNPYYAPPKTTRDYLTPFQEAARACRPEQVKMCLDRGDVDLDQVTLDGRTLMDLVGRRRAVKDLLLAERRRRNNAVPERQAA